MDANFYDPETGEQFLFTQHRTLYREGKWITVEIPSGKQIISPTTNNILEHIPKEGVPTMLKGNNKESLKKMLQKRSHDHFKKEIEPIKQEKNNKLNNPSN